MKKKGKHIEFYYRCITSGVMPWHGLCNNGLNKRNLELFKPRGEGEFENATSHDYWAFDGDLCAGIYDRAYSFGALRQNIVLFMAAMNGEL